MIGFRRLSKRRKVLLAALAALLLGMGVMTLLGVAGFRGTQPQEMDWNADGEVTRREILQGYTLVAAEDATDGNRTCRSFAWLRDRANPIRVDCRVDVAGNE